MSTLGEPRVEADESFGPGTDLVVSLLAVLLLVLFLAVQSIRSSAFRKSRAATAPEQLWELRERYREAPPFEQDHAELTFAARRQVDSQIEAFRKALRDGRFNQLLVEGYASPETSQMLSIAQRERWNFQLSFDRALAVADYLYERGIPYECLAVAGFGRSHSSNLRRWLKGNTSRTIAEWDRAFSSSSSEFAERDLANERVVRIIGINHEESVCTMAPPR